MNLEKLKQTIKDRNAKFAKLSRPQQRVAIAKDVLASIDTNKIVPTNMVYINTDSKLCDSILNKPGEQLCNIIQQMPSCNVCAKGALFVSAVKQKGNIKAQKLIHKYAWEEKGCVAVTEEKISDYLKTDNLFSKKQLDMIENQFEQDNINGVGSYRSWKPRIKDASGRMKAIMKNIIENKGTFKPFAKRKSTKKTVEVIQALEEEVNNKQQFNYIVEG